MRNVSLCGFYGYENYGDTLMLRGLCRFINSEGAQCLPFSDRGTLEAHHYTKLPLNDEGIIALGGGGIITPNFWFFKQGLEKKIPNHKLILLNVGLTTESIPVFEKIKNQIELIVVRDKFSLELATRYYPEEMVIYTPDIGFYRFDPVEEVKAEKIVTVCLNYYIFKNYFSSNNRDRIFAEKAIIELATFLNWLETLGYSTCIVPCQTDTEVNDNTVNAVLNGFLNKKAKWIYNNYEIENVISKSSLVISSRYHSSLFALKSGVPFIDITHHSKNLNFLKDVGLTDFSVNYWNLELNTLKEKYEKVINFSKLKEIRDAYGVYCKEGWRQVSSALNSLI
jgi:polysaccharide pyruvyl transferase WcaK-like protein